MKRIIVFLGIIYCAMLTVLAQNNPEKQQITLKNGTVYVGKITLQNNSVLMLQAEDGTRYQFPANDVKSVLPFAELQVPDVAEKTAGDTVAALIFKISTNLHTGFYPKNRAFDPAAHLSADIVFGIKNSHSALPYYWGMGAGYENIFSLPENVNLLKFFFRVQRQFSTKKIVPYTVLDLGYALIANENWTGGLFAKAGGGVCFGLGNNNSLLLGFTFGVQSCRTTLTEIRNSIPYTYTGNTHLPQIGLSAGILF